METEPKYVIIGCFVLSLLVGMMGLAVYFSKIDYTKGDIYAIYFKGSVAGLRTNEIVTYNGVPIGYVKAIDIDPHHLELIRVLAKIEQPNLIKQGSKAILEVKGISGSLFIRIYGSSQTAPQLVATAHQKYPVIESEHSAFQQLVSDAPKIAQRLVELTEKLIPFFDQKNNESFKDILQSLSSLSASIDKSTQTNLLEIEQLMQEIRSVGLTFNRILNKFEDNPRKFLLQGVDEDEYVIAP